MLAIKNLFVALFARAWIEIPVITLSEIANQSVALFTRAWIEIAQSYNAFL